MKRIMLFLMLSWLCVTAHAQTGTRISWDKETTGRASRYDVVLTTATLSGVAAPLPVNIVYATDAPATQTLANGRVYADVPGIPKPGVAWRWYIRSRSKWGVISPWSEPAYQDMRSPSPPKGLKVEAKP